MRAYRWLVALVFMAGGLHAQTVGSLASSACPLGGCAQGGTGTVTTTGTLASGQVALVSGRVALSSGAASLTDDAGCTWTGTGSSFVGTFGGGLIVGSEAALFNTYKGANSDGLNLFIGGGGQSSVGAVGETHKGSRNTFFGIGAGTSNTTGYYNTFNGMQAGYSNTTGYANTFNGTQAGYSNTTGTGLVALGNSAGRYETGSNAFYVNNIDQTDTAGDKAYSLLYGTFAGTAGTTTGNTLRVNGLFYAPLISSDRDASGTNTAGTNLIVQPQAGTGNATGSSLIFQTPTAGASGTTAQTQTTRLTLAESAVIAAVPVRLMGYTVATLPAGTVGDTAYVTDATAPTYLGALTGGGAVTVPVFYNGAACVSH